MKLTAWLASALAVGLAVATPAGSAAQSPTGDSLTGSARDCTDPPSCLTNPNGLTLFTSITADAHSGPSGENPSGTVSWGERILGGAGFLDSQDRVTCLSVSGNEAVVGVAGTTNLVRFNIILWNAGLIRVTDGGGPNSELDTFQFAIQTQPIVFPPPPPPPDPTDCSSFPSGAPALRNEEGDLTVTDVRPSPTSKDQCKDGGWRTYGVFKNQGDCVRFVIHQATQACLFERAAIGPRAFRDKYGVGRFDLFAMLHCIHHRAGG